MKLILTLIALSLSGCANADPYQRIAEQERARIAATPTKTFEQRQEEQRLVEYAQNWHNAQLRKQGYIVCEQKSSTITACK